ncbi:C6 transcription factor [Stagonosporopsis vannaccii]|nr:C6 transcription factor [Stagonosporopsis vannaccii]
MNYIPSALRPQGRDRVHNVEDGLSGSTLPMAFGTPAQAVINPATMENDHNSRLANFRHMVGIHSTRGFSGVADTTHNNLHFDGRAAPNLGIYNRVCHREAQAKRGYKLASFFINGCLGLQVIVAAALTAMGAANTNHVSITAFGAINTVIAGILTYLKGSGLPNRIRWAENEWKKVREYIEQRERDFSRPDCRLDMNEVVQVIEAMYEEVKADVQNNTPDAYISMSDLRNRGQPTNPQVPRLQSMIQGAQSQGQSKLQELELKYGHRLTEFLEGLAHKEEERLRKLESELEATKGRVVQVGQNAVQSGKDWEKEMQEKGMRVAEREIEHARAEITQRRNDFERSVTATTVNALQNGRNWEQDLEQRGLQAVEREIEQARGDIDHGRRELERGVEAAKNNISQLGQSLGQQVETQGARVADTQREIERETRRAQDAVNQAQESAQNAAAGIRGFADSMQRIGKAVQDELPQQKRI